jgi:hypothetical protein
VRGQTYVYIYEVHFDGPLEAVRFNFLIITISWLEIGGIYSDSFSDATDSFESGGSVRISFAFQCFLK